MFSIGKINLKTYDLQVVIQKSWLTNKDVSNGE